MTQEIVETPTYESIISKCINTINSLNNKTTKDILELKGSFTIVVPLDDTQKELTERVFKDYKFGNQRLGNEKYKFGSRPLRYLYNRSRENCLPLGKSDESAQFYFP